MAHPQFEAVGMLLSGPDGSMPLIGIPLRFDGERPPFRSHPPALGEHSRAVLAHDGEPSFAGRAGPARP
jgi:crotonobetainyl-CoA:carnitine CoA-transferase CaiB-like acyl-CoA transferase